MASNAFYRQGQGGFRGGRGGGDGERGRGRGGRGGFGGRKGSTVKWQKRRREVPGRSRRSKVITEPHRHEGAFIAKGKEDALVTKNMVQAVYNKKRISVQASPYIENTYSGEVFTLQFNVSQVMVARGDLGAELPIEEVPLLQFTLQMAMFQKEAHLSTLTPKSNLTLVRNCCSNSAYVVPEL